MVARNIRCIVIEVPVQRLHRGALNAASRDLLPWADPYIAGLVAKLKAEIQADRALRKERAGKATLRDELLDEAQLPFSTGELEFECPDREGGDRG